MLTRSLSQEKEREFIRMSVLPPPPLPHSPRNESPSPMNNINNLSNRSVLKSGTGELRKAVSLDFGPYFPKDTISADMKYMGPTKVQRLIDGLRKHKTTQSDLERLDIPGDVGHRIDLQTITGVLLLCGCQKGVRLTTDEIKYATRTVAGLASSFKIIENIFLSLPSRQKGVVVKADTEKVPDNCPDVIANYLELAEMWINLYNGLVTFILEKQMQLPMVRLAVRQIAVEKELSQKGNTSRSTKYPGWLSALMHQYAAENPLYCAKVAGLDSPDLDNVALFARFLARCIVNYSGLISPAHIERHHLEELVRASDDGTGNISLPLLTNSASLREKSIARTDETANTSNEQVAESSQLKRAIVARPHSYWTRRIWMFLKSLHELRGVAGRDPKSLEDALRMPYSNS